MHDEATQTLANLALHLQICERAIAVDVERGKAELVAARTALSEAIGRLRAQIFELRPQILEEAGLVTTLRRYLQARALSSVDLVDSTDGARHAPAVELGMYRVAQAAIRAGATRLELRRDGLEATGLSEVTEDVREWAEALGATLDVGDGRLSLTL